MKIRPLYDRILVKRIEEQSRTASGLYIPDSAKEKPMEATIVAVGNGKIQEDGSLRKLEVKAGDKILFSKYSGSDIKIDGVEHLILREDDILAVIEKFRRRFFEPKNTLETENGSHRHRFLVERAREHRQRAQHPGQHREGDPGTPRP